MKGRWLLLAYALANAALYSMLLPLWEGFDEPFHFGYVQHLANGYGLPDPRTSCLSREVGSSLLLAPGSLSVRRNIPQITSYPEFFAWPEARRQQAHRQLSRIDPGLRWQPSDRLDYEGLQAPAAYAVLAPPERALAKWPLPWRVLALRILAGGLGALLLLFAAERLAGQLGIAEPYKQIAIFCALSCQMTWATMAHVANDWLAVPLTVWLLVTVIHYQERPSGRRAALAAGVLSLGLLTKAYFIAFIPLPVAVCIFRRRWRDLGVALLIVLALTAPWYARNVQRYGTISGMQELRQGVNPAAAWGAIRIERLPAAIESYARGALWTGNNSFGAFSIRTLRAVMAVWLAALVLWAAGRQRSAEWIVLLHCGVFTVALAYDAAINYVASHGEVASPAAWYTQVLVVPMLALGLLGAGRSRRAGKAVAASMTLLFGYILAATYWAKLIPLYGGFEGRTSLAAVATLYLDRARLSTLAVRLNEICLAPAGIILCLSGLVSILAAGQQVILTRWLLEGQAGRREKNAGITPCPPENRLPSPGTSAS